MFFRKKKHIESLTDEELVIEYQRSEDSVFVGELFERYTHVVYLVCMKYLKNPAESEDMSMQVFEKLMKDLKKYEVRSFKYWLHTVTKNQCLVLLDKKKRERAKEDQMRETGQGLMESGPNSYLNDEDDLQEVHLTYLEQALTKLNLEQRHCLELFYLQQKSYQEVSDSTGYSMKQVKSYIQNGKRNLKKHLSYFADGAHIEQTNE